MEQFGKILVGLGAALLVMGALLWVVADKVSWFGRLPGDIRVERPGLQLYAPFTTMLLLSLGLSLVLWLLNRFFR